MKLALVLHLYQPSTQNFETFKAVCNECYTPLLKLLRSNKQIQLTLNVPLSVLEMMEKYGYGHLITGIKELVDLERVELTGSGAYHPLLTRVTKEFCEQQIVLQEYAVGYYFGRLSGFEGEKSVMVRDLRGFFPPELALNETLLWSLNEFGYDWVLADECSVLPGLTTSTTDKPFVFQLDGCNTRIITRDTTLSNMLSFKRNTVVSDLFEYVSSNGRSEYVVALDAEFFGHHFKQGLYLLDFISQEMDKLGGEFVTVTKMIEDKPSYEIKKLFESSWGATSFQVVNNEPYPYWVNSENPLLVGLWELHSSIQAFGTPFFTDKHPNEEYANVAVWNDTEIEKISDISVRDSVRQNLEINKCLSSDQFWWASKQQLLNNYYLYNPDMVRKYLDTYRNFLTDSSSLKIIEDLFTQL